MTSTQPLTGIRVVDLTRVLSGPFSTMLLADMGADVIKIETPQGDTVRTAGAAVNGLSWYFASFNRNKRSVVLDLRRDEGKSVLARLIQASLELHGGSRHGQHAGAPAAAHSRLEERGGLVQDLDHAQGDCLRSGLHGEAASD